jgi:phosphatidylglycerol phospholipase C
MASSLPTPPGGEQMLRKVPSALNVPPMLVQPGVEKLNSPATIPADTYFPKPTFTTYRFDSRKRRMPQCISHRGYKAKFPENTMASFRGAVEVGTHALETDVHVTKDEVVVLSHDPSLKRCFGVDKKIKECTWEEIKDFRTVAAGPSGKHESMPRLQDMLEYLMEPGLEDTWLLLDIKLSNDADQIMRLLGSTIESINTSSLPSGRKAKPWTERIVLGIWAAKYLPLAIQYLPDFPISHIGFSLPYARHFFEVPNVSFNMLIPILIAPGGKRFIREAKETHHRQLYAWTVNDKDKMEWCIRRQLDGVITDDPAKFLSVCDSFDETKAEPWMALTLLAYLDVIRICVWIFVAKWFFRKYFLPVASHALIRKGIAEANGHKKGLKN